ncbi:unnamed protein product [Thelazia callipaeda]|uniref:GLOBIN domain-containing protein n=1 Tax=Thelazia callipaeda TaxID=103827 RepID=A0A0N5D2B7_THECL|nr:unnamed protein product [Thelazia callipaeda]
MLKVGWLLCRSLYSEKFSCAITLEELKKQANSVVTSIAGHPCSQKRFFEESTKRVSSQNSTLRKIRYTSLRSLTEEQPQAIEEIKDFWGTMWNFGMAKYDDIQHNEYLEEFVPGDEVDHTFPFEAEFGKIVSYLPNWKAAGLDGVYNFIKKCTSLHPYLHKIARRICLDGTEQNPWFYKSITYLIPKGVQSKGSNFRPITCMSNLYELTTKCMAHVM